MTGLGQDLKYALRALLKRPLRAALVAGVVGLGLGAAATVLTVLDAFLVEPLPFPEASRLVWIESLQQGQRLGVSHLDYQDWRRLEASFADLAKLNAKEHSVLSSESGAESVLATRTTSNLFSVLGVAPQLGRALDDQDDLPDSSRSLLLSHRLWVRSFAAHPEVVGRSVTFDGALYTVVGVMPPGFHFPVASDVWVASSAWADQWTHRAIRVDSVVGRLQPGVTLAGAQAALDALADRLQRDHPDTNSGLGALILPLREVWIGDSRAGLWLLLMGCGFLLLVAATNVANLLLAWAAAREKESTLRLALGCPRLRLLRQSLVESLLLALGGSGVGVLIALWGIQLVARSIPVALPVWMGFDLNGRVLLQVIALAAAMAVVFGMVPALRTSGTDAAGILRGLGHVLGDRDSRWLRRGLIVSQVAIALLLAVGAGLVGKSYARLHGVDPGFETADRYTVELDLPVFALGSYQQVRDLYRQLLERLSGLPGVAAVGATTTLPLVDRGGPAIRWEVTIEGQDVESQKANPRPNGQAVTADYFQAMGIAFGAGRSFEGQDSQAATQGAIVSASFARRFWPTSDAVGQRFRLGPASASSPLVTVVGVVEDVRRESLAQADALDLYLPLERIPSWPVHLVFGMEESQGIAAAQLRREIWAVWSDLGVRELKPLGQVVADSLWRQRTWTVLILAFSGVALGLAALGVYGVASQQVAARTPEIGLRIALGARRGDIFKLVVKEGILLSCVGIAAGLVATLALVKYLSTLLYEVSTTDPLVFLLAIAAVLSAGVVASSLPLRRAASADPVRTLRYQ